MVALNVGKTGRELADMMQVDVLCGQESKWRGSRGHNIGAGFELFYHDVNRKRNGIPVVLKEFTRTVVEVNKASDRVTCLKVETEGLMVS